jgi:hypothetical protein
LETKSRELEEQVDQLASKSWHKGKMKKGGFNEGQEGKRLPHVKQRKTWER